MSGLKVAVFGILFALVGQAAVFAADVSCRRTMEKGDAANQQLVNLHLTMPQGKLESLIIKETLPDGWVFEGAVPSPDSYDKTKNIVKWLSISNAESVAIIHYIVTAPSAGALSEEIQGSVAFKDPAGKHKTIDIRD